MGAFVDHVFERGYYLDEERLRKINEILVSRGKVGQDSHKPAYKVYRSDAFTYITDDIQTILNEDNAEWQKINRITIALQVQELSLELDFDPKRTLLHIEGGDRDSVFLLFSELRQYLANEVNVIRKNVFTTANTRIFFLVLPLIILFIAMTRLISPSGDKLKLAQDAFNSQDISVKLNYIINKDITTSSPFSDLTLYLFIVVMIVTTFGENLGKLILKPINYLFPDYLFLFGKEVQRHAKRLNLRQNLLWGVIISSIISLITGLIVWYVTK